MSMPRSSNYRPVHYNDAAMWPDIVPGTPEAENWLETYFQKNYDHTNKQTHTALPNVGRRGLRDLLVKLLMYTIKNDPAVRQKVTR